LPGTARVQTLDPQIPKDLANQEGRGMPARKKTSI